MLGEWPEATEAALLAEYGRDMVGEFWRGEISLRMLRVAVEGLPPGSAMHRKYRRYEWTQADELRAATVDQLLILRWMFASVNRAKDAPAPEFPEMVTRPWEVEERERKRAEEAAATAKAREWFANNILPQLKT